MYGRDELCHLLCAPCTLDLSIYRSSLLTRANGRPLPLVRKYVACSITLVLMLEVAAAMCMTPCAIAVHVDIMCVCASTPCLFFSRFGRLSLVRFDLGDSISPLASASNMTERSRIHLQIATRYSCLPAGAFPLHLELRNNAGRASTGRQSFPAPASI